METAHLEDFCCAGFEDAMTFQPEETSPKSSAFSVTTNRSAQLWCPLSVLRVEGEHWEHLKGVPYTGNLSEVNVRVEAV